MIVVDVNVLAYLLIEGERTRGSESVLAADAEWAAPLLWRSEWRNVLAGHLWRGELDRAAVLERLDAAEELYRGREYLVDGARVLDLVAASPCSAYDCEYVALAETLDVPLVTNDGPVLAAFPDRALKPEAFVVGEGGPA
ncbi:MAG: type II toxin-antitoxin system VapC family toxin [Gemmatimonadota bacterium]|nr:type II toxin-antitoxin system VapC family toxin [Gemmatimonadota bacterium]